jgi:hypothetical protein
LEVASYREVHHKISAYFEWLALQYINTDLKFEDLYKYAEYLYLFDRYKSRLQQKDIFRYSYRELIDTVLRFKRLSDSYIPLQLDEETISIIKEDIKHRNVELIYPSISQLSVTTPYHVLQINNKQSSIKYGCNTEWCITRPGNSMWEHYTENSIDDVFYFLFINGKEKYAYYYDRSRGIDIYDQSDNNIPVSKFTGRFPFMKNLITKDYLNPFQLWDMYNEYTPVNFRSVGGLFNSSYKLESCNEKYIKIAIEVGMDEFIHSYLDSGDSFDIGDLGVGDINSFLNLLNQPFNLSDVSRTPDILLEPDSPEKEVLESYLLNYNITGFIESNFTEEYGSLYYTHTFTPKEFFETFYYDDGEVTTDTSYFELIENAFKYKIDFRKLKRDLDELDEGEE